MSLRRLKVFQVVARTGSFTRAAGDLSMTQPAVSFQVKQLEAEVSAQLIDRSTRELKLTHAGERVLSYADRIIALHHEMKTEMASLVKEPMKAR